MIAGRIGNARLVLANATASSGPRIALEEIPEEVKAEVEEIVVALAKTPGGRMHVEFQTPEQLKTYLGQVASYCEYRTPQLYYRKSPQKGLGLTEAMFRVETLESKEAREKAAEEALAKREAKKAASANGSVAPAKKTATAKK